MLDVDALLRPYFDRLAADVGGPRPLRRPHPRRRQRSGRVHPDPGAAAEGARRRRRARRRVPDARARRLPGGQRLRDRRRRGVGRHDGALLPRRPARRRRRGGHARAGRRRARDQAAPAGGAVRPRRARRARRRRARARAARAGADPRRPRDPGARAAHRRPQRRVPRRQADPRPRRDLRPRVAVEGDARAPQPVRGHRVVEPGRPDGAVLPRAAGADPVGERLAVRAAGDVRRGGAALRAAGRPGARRPCARSRAARWRGCSRASRAPTPGRRRGVVRPLDPHLERVVTHLVGAMGRAFARTDPEEPLALARLACAVGSRPGVRAGVRGRARPARPLRGAQARAADRRPPVPARRALRRDRAGRRAHAGRRAARAPGRAGADARRGRAGRGAPSPRRAPTWPPPPPPVSGGRVQSE